MPGLQQTAPRGLIGGAPVVHAEDDAKRKYRREPGFPVPILIAPATIWLVVFLFLPLISIFIFSFWKSTGHGMTPAFTLENYRAFFVSEGFFDPKQADFLTPSIFIRTLWTTFRFTITVMAICLILAYPLAYFLSMQVEDFKWQLSLFLLAMVPFWTSYLIRAVAWLPMLGRHGLINEFLISNRRHRRAGEFLPLFRIQLHDGAGTALRRAGGRTDLLLARQDRSHAA